MYEFKMDMFDDGYIEKILVFQQNNWVILEASGSIPAG